MNITEHSVLIQSDFDYYILDLNLTMCDRFRISNILLLARLYLNLDTFFQVSIVSIHENYINWETIDIIESLGHFQCELVFKIIRNEIQL